MEVLPDLLVAGLRYAYVILPIPNELFDGRYMTADLAYYKPFTRAESFSLMPSRALLKKSASSLNVYVSAAIATLFLAH